MANDQARIPSYLTRNRVGTFVFQARIPRHILSEHRTVKPLVRCSLRTKDRTEAMRRSMRLWLRFDAAISNYCDPVSFEREIADLLAGKLCDSPHQTAPVPVERTESSVDAADDSPTVGQLVVRFMAYKRDTGARAASLKWYDQKVHQFAAIIEALNQGGRLRVSELTTEMMRNYATVMYRYPKHAQTRKLTRDMPEQARVKLVLEHDRDSLRAMGIEPIGFQTVGHNFTAVRELLRFAEKQQYPIAHNLGDLIPTAKKKRGEKPQVKFDTADLKALFHSHEYRTGEFERASDYWMPLLAVFGGQTQAELCQLHAADIQRRNGIWYIDINDQAEKLLKTEGGRPRQVPLHHQLIRLGFLDFVESCRQRGQVRLFPNEIRDEHDKYAGYSKRFNRWRKRLGIDFDSNGGRKTFHSFRHLVSDWLVGNQCHPGVAADIIGHEGRDRTETRRTYSDGAWLVEKDQWIQRLDYGVEWSNVAPWKQVAGSCRS